MSTSVTTRSPFAGIKDVSSQQRGLPLLPGEYTLSITELKYFISSRDKMQVFAIMAEVVTSTHPDRPRGSIVSQAIKMNPKFPDYFFANIKDFMVAVNQGEPIEDSDVDEAVSPTQPCRGVHVRANVSLHMNKDGTKEYARAVWMPAPQPE